MRVPPQGGVEKEMATHSSIPAWRIPWTEEPGGLQPTGSQRVGHDCKRLSTRTSTFISTWLTAAASHKRLSNQ